MPGSSRGPFSASVTASYEQTSSREEINAVTFSEEESFTDTYSVVPDQNKIIVYGLWQLVDVFTIVDEDKEPIHTSNTLEHADLEEIPRITFFNKDVIRQSATKFDP